MKLKPLLAIAASLGLGGLSHGAEYYVYTTPDLPYFSLNNGSVYNGTFNLTGAGYNPATMLITNATLYVWFADDNGGDSGNEYADVHVDGTLVGNNVEYNGYHSSSGMSTWDKKTFVLDSYASIIAAVQDGILTFSVTDKDGDGYLKEAKLKVTAGDKPPPPPPPGVPDNGGTAIALGLGLLALFAARRRIGTK